MGVPTGLFCKGQALDRSVQHWALRPLTSLQATCSPLLLSPSKIQFVQAEGAHRESTEKLFNVTFSGSTVHH
jgi:hypothetical protein